MGKKLIKIPVGSERILFNSLYEHPDKSDLAADILAIELPTKQYIDVGWYPQFDESGEYKVRLLDQDGFIVEEIYNGRDVKQVIAMVEKLIKRSI